MAILNYTTKISPVKTIAEISECLVKHGATKIVTDYSGQTPVALTFSISMQGSLVLFSLPCNYSSVLKAMTKDKSVPRKLCCEDQALRVSWRILKEWVQAQCAIIESQLAELPEVFLPYAVTKSGSTLYRELKENPNNLLTT